MTINAEMHEKVAQIKKNRKFVILPAQAMLDPRLSSTDKSVLGALALLANSDKFCWPSTAMICLLCNLDPEKSKRNIHRNINNLTELGYIIKHERYRANGSRSSNGYEIIFDAPATPDDIPEDPMEDDDDMDFDTALPGGKIYQGGGVMGDTRVVSPDTTPYNQYNINQERDTRAKKISMDRNKGDEPMAKPLSKDAPLTEERRKLILDGGIHPTQVDRVWNEFKSYRISKGDKRVDWDADLCKWCLGCRSFNKWAFEEDSSLSKQSEKKPRPDFTGETFTDQILEALYGMVDGNIYHSWLEKLTFKFDEEAKKVIVIAPSKFVIDWITTNRVDNNILFSSFDVGCEAESVEFKVS